jgi:cellulose synthase/poly-beta-1,6-N-acetylglucosamine synthase-like glycosyltransferase
LSDVGVFIIARNEEKNIEKTIEGILSQRLKPKKIILINDNSTDNTKKIAEKFHEVTVLDFPISHPSWLMTPQLAEICNFGLSEIKKSGKYDYVLRLDSDQIMPPNYILEIVSEMDKNTKIVAASGIIKGETQSWVRGSGRIHRASYLDMINWKHPVKWGWEDYVILKAESMGFLTKVFPIITQTQRPTDTDKSISEIYYMKGKAFRALGYYFPWVLVFILREYKTNFKAAFFLLKGYFSKGIELHEKELRDYITLKQKGVLLSKLKIR